MNMPWLDRQHDHLDRRARQPCLDPKIYDEFHSQERLIVTVLPENPSPPA